MRDLEKEKLVVEMIERKSTYPSSSYHQYFALAEEYMQRFLLGVRTVGWVKLEFT